MKPTQASSALHTWREGNYALLADLDMPEMDGYTLATTIRRGEAGRLRLPILALTANALRGEANRARAAGMDEYLTKPVLLRLIREALERCLTQANPSIPPLRGTPPGQSRCIATGIRRLGAMLLEIPAYPRGGGDGNPNPPPRRQEIRDSEAPCQARRAAGKSGPRPGFHAS